ncbi:hypothetical protein M501DRAFT_856095 [Patellaria atrata CBS 101060]|uniref:SRP9 domain-containing protein n=1 Tax=Patellaria atrata CBS 101060 TaxID=1346257 RepID=A0A9P4S8Q4_9PEZI|nr:hypothetical protein M501DRAFT_856095 [Patellaria atrata CBS 101060]
MPYLETSQEWMKQSSLLLQARPTTTIITTKYSILGLKNSKIQKRKRKQDGKDGSATASASAAAGTASNPATITLKTWDPLSGACLKYQTNKAAEVGRLISALGKLARTMAALPEIPGGKSSQ